MNTTIDIRSIAAVTLLALPALGQAVVSPADRDRFEGSSMTSYPLGRARMRLQQLIGDLPATPLTLRGHAYRRDAATVRGIVAGFRAQVSVRASLSPRAADGPSATFADNHGTQVHALLDQAWLSLPQTDRPPVDPAPQFELRLPWANPFPWTGSGVLCLETLVHGNDVGGTPDRNFTSYQDAHELATSTSRQPGYRFGDGCPFPGSTTRAYATLDLVRTPAGLDLEVAVRAGAPTDANGPGLNVLLLGVGATPWSWPMRPECTVYLPPVASEVLGTSDSRGSLDVVRRGMGDVLPGRTLFAQVLSLQPATAQGALTDATRLTSPAPIPSRILHSRVANGDDSAALTGTVSFAVPVTQVF